jgi:UDP-N-acetylglucosamine 4,6-dehydratase/5-epimerase
VMQWNELTLFVAGGTGSFGKKFAAVVLKKYRPKKLIIFSRDELKQSEMRQQFAEYDSTLRFFIGDVRDHDRLCRAMQGVDIVVHAAALKQIPSCEYNPFEAVMTNIIGSRNVIDAAIDCGVKRAILVSTDKAVNPVNLYGATKLCAEKLFIHGNAYSGAKGARFAAVRYGNVVGSRGSVVPLFAEQRKNGCVTITDERMTRFWITLEKGVNLVVRVIEEMKGGEIFVPKLPSMRVVDLAEAIAKDAKVRVIGIRPGEKLHEQLISEHEARYALEYEDHFVILAPHAWEDRDYLVGGRPVPDGFRYSSDNNSTWLDPTDFAALVANHPELTDLLAKPNGAQSSVRSSAR